MPRQNGERRWTSPRSQAVNQRVQELWAALRTPAASIAELADRLDWSEADTRYMIWFVRHEPVERFRWTVPHVQRGWQGGDRRYFRVRLDPSGVPLFDMDPSLYPAVMVGALGTLREVAEKGAALARGLNGSAAHSTQAFQKRELRLIARTMDFVVAQVRELAAELQNGRSA